jgi:hypothetical protein
MKDLNELNSLYQEADTALNAHFAEIRSNILLDIGYHHPRRDRHSNSRGPYFRQDKGKSAIRFTANHIQVVTKFIRNSIQNRAPGGAILPQNPKELSDQKSAELNLSVYECLREKNDLDDFYSRLIHDFVVCGETYAKVFYDVMGGKFLGYETAVDAEGIPVGEPVPHWEGDIVYEKLSPYNWLSDPQADSKREVKWGCYRKLIPRKVLEAKYAHDEAKMKAIAGGAEDNFQWFDGVTGIYSDVKDGVEVREFYWRPGQEFPNGYFYFATNSGILEQGELPDGFCIFSALYDESPANPRAYSVIKSCKPYQSEINRCASAIIKESIILGHSTVMYSAGSKMTTSSIGNGLKGLQYTGSLPTVIPGSAGRQYEDYMTRVIAELYKVAKVPMQNEEKESAAAGDSFAMLYRTMRDKMGFSIYGEKIEKLITEIIDHSLKLARGHYTDEKVIPIVGKREQVNIPEFRDSSPDQYKIKIVPRTDDFSQMMGKSLQISQALQYLGGSLSPEMGAELVRQMPFLSDEPLLGDMMVKKDQADSVILALDRGETPFYFETAEHEYLLQRLTRRMNEADFPILPEKTQMNYQERIERHTEALMSQQQEAARATAGYIPSGGGLISADYYVSSPEGKQHRVRIPYESMDWLVKKLNDQGSSVDKIGELPLSTQAEMGKQAGKNEMNTQPQVQGQQAPTQQGSATQMDRQIPMTGT